MSTRDEPVLARGLNVNVHAVRRVLRKVRTQPMATRLMISSVPIKTSPARPLRHRGTIIYDPIPVNLTYAALLFSNFISCKVACRHSYSSIFLVFLEKIWKSNQILCIATYIRKVNLRSDYHISPGIKLMPGI